MVEKEGNGKPVLLSWGVLSATKVGLFFHSKLFGLLYKIPRHLQVMSIREGGGRCFTPEINNRFSARLMAKLCAWQRGGAQVGAGGRRLAFSVLGMVLLWSNLRP